MKNLTLLTLTLMVLMAFMACETAEPLTGYETETAGDFLPDASGRKSSGGGETAYAGTGLGTLSGFNETDDPDYGVFTYTLWAGKTNDAGFVTITNDDENIYVSYNTNETADLGEVHVYVWTNEADIPTRRPAPGHADYVIEDINDDAITVTIPVADLGCGDTFYISTHAALVVNATDGDEQAEGDNAGATAYAAGNDASEGFPNQTGAWWGFITYAVECYYDISGALYEDANNSGELEEGENAFENITVSLLDANGNIIEMTTTDTNGNYTFEHVTAGEDYTVVSGSPEGDYLANENANGYSINDLSTDEIEINFGYVPLYDISGIIFNDMDNNSDMNGDDNGYEDIVVNLLDADGNIVATTITDANGVYLFENIVGGGDYQIVVIDLDGMVSTENAGGFNISNLGSDITNIDFGFYTPNSGDDDDNNDFAVGNCAMDYTLWAGQYNDAGTVTISSDSDFLYVTYNTNITADLGTLHIDVTSSTPDERGAPGQYFYNSDQDALFSSGTDSYTVILSLDDLGLNCDDIIYVKAHAALIGDGIGGGGDNAGETAYSGPDASGSTGETAFGGWYLSSGPGSGGSWFYYMTASVCCSTM